jgi:long-chain acyl-CoA synthetase
VSFLDNILGRLAQSPARIVIEELRPTGSVSVTARELLEQVARARAFFASAGLRKGDRCALLASNSIPWAALDLAATAQGIVVVPLYTRQAPAELAAMLRDAQPSFVCCGNSALRDALLAAWPDAPATALVEEVLAASSVDVLAASVPLADSDPVTIIYTSGTSGEAKGVVLTAANVDYILSCTSARLDLLMGKQSRPDRIFHYLPFCFASSWLLLLSGLSRSSILLLSTDLTRLADDLRTAAPDYCVNVPALLERIRAAIESQLAARGGVSNKIFRKAQMAWLRRQSGSGSGGALSLALARAILFPAIRSKFGRNLKALVCGSAPLARETQLFFMMLGIPVLQVYGLTETTGICTMDDPGRVEPGTVGPAIPGSEMKLGDADEILVRGPNVFCGYWNRPADTAKALAGGWFHTGDRGERTPAGNWRITGRLKNLLILSSGHNIAPEPLEEKLVHAVPGIQQAVVVGHGRSYLAVLLIGDVPPEKAEEELARLNATLPHYRQIRAFHIEPKPLTIENGLLTANGKLRREAVMERFREAIEAMYHGMGA